MNNDDFRSVDSEENTDRLSVVGLLLKEQRRRLNLSQRELSVRLKISATHLSNIENGKVNFSVMTFMSIIDELNKAFCEFHGIKLQKQKIPAEVGRLIIDRDLRERRLIVEEYMEKMRETQIQ